MTIVIHMTISTAISIPQLVDGWLVAFICEALGKGMGFGFHGLLQCCVYVIYYRRRHFVCHIAMYLRWCFRDSLYVRVCVSVFWVYVCVDKRVQIKCKIDVMVAVLFCV